MDDMPEVRLVRIARSDQGTEGKVTDGNFNCYSLELPWNNNMRSISCIPPGEYQVIPKQSPQYGRIYCVSNVTDRTGILIHSGNYAGDPTKNLKTHTMGCILLGEFMGFLGKQRAILNSRVTVRLFMEHMNYEPFILNVIDSI